jgi:hypothetical protein
VNSSDCPNRIENLEINQVEDGFIIYYPERDSVHFLNPSAVFVLELCNGKHEAAEIPVLVREAYGLRETPEREIRDLLTQLVNEGLIVA